MKKRTLLLFFVGIFGQLYAQDYENRPAAEGMTRKLRHMASFSLVAALPQGLFRDLNNHVGFGLRGNVTTAVRHFPIQIGFDGGYITQQTARREFKNGNATFQDRYKVKANSNVVSLGFTARFDPFAHHRNSPVQPFIDATVGTNAFFSSVETAYYDNGEWNSKNTNTKPRWAYMYGGSLGVGIPVGKQMRIEVKGSYYFGDRTKYKTDPVIDALGTVEFTEKKSETTMLIPQIGLNWLW
ncbi:hypothetical protein [Runella sp.]|uniref:hypothetical protein n=1 Tax=Runella sp. TaxID=1960881 RepID=UPI0030166948